MTWFAMRIIISFSIRINVSPSIHSDVNRIDFDVRDVELAAAFYCYGFDEELDRGRIDRAGDGFNEGGVLHTRKQTRNEND